MEHSKRQLLLGLGGTFAAALAPDLMGASAKPHARRRRAVAGARRIAAAPAPAPLRAPPGAEDIRRLRVHNLHTGDKLDAVYFENGQYVHDALSEAMKVLRDWRNGQEHYMDPRLFDALHAVSGRLETTQPFQLISGYRSPATNAMLHERSSGVASRSQHTLGKATDVRIEGVDLKRLHAAALDVRAGGVGFYPVSNFVHVDVGPVRQWRGA